MRRKALAHAILGALVIVAALAACGDSSGSHDRPPYFAAKPFDHARWIATDDGRGAMVEDLIAHHLRVGASRAGVAALLGIEITRDARHASVEVGATLNCLTCGYLALDFDAEGRLLRAYIEDD